MHVCLHALYVIRKVGHAVFGEQRVFEGEMSSSKVRARAHEPVDTSLCVERGQVSVHALHNGDRRDGVQ